MKTVSSNKLLLHLSLSGNDFRGYLCKQHRGQHGSTGVSFDPSDFGRYLPTSSYIRRRPLSCKGAKSSAIAGDKVGLQTSPTMIASN